MRISAGLVGDYLVKKLIAKTINKELEWRISSPFNLNKL
jgi:hypothetical protein